MTCGQQEATKVSTETNKTDGNEALKHKQEYILNWSLFTELHIQQQRQMDTAVERNRGTTVPHLWGWHGNTFQPGFYLTVCACVSGCNRNPQNHDTLFQERNKSN
jgi:hypothetical protein